VFILALKLQWKMNVRESERKRERERELSSTELTLAQQNILIGNSKGGQLSGIYRA
jgi:hypothetical protein